MGDDLLEAPRFPMARSNPLNPPSELADIQQRHPVSRVTLWDGSRPWLVTGYEHVKNALASPHLSVDTSLPSYPHWNAGTAAMHARVTTFDHLDDPLHARQRRMVASTFIVKRMVQLRPRIIDIVDAGIDSLVAGPNPADLVRSFALPVPSLVICEVLGVPYEDHAFFQEISETVLARTSTPDAAVQAKLQLHEYLGGLVDSYARGGGHGLIGRLVEEYLIPGESTREEIVSIADLILVAGHETTANMIALGTLALILDPVQRTALVTSDDPMFVANAIEELLRFLTVTHSGRRRVALSDVEIGGRLIKAGEGVIIANDIANRDPAVFPEPDRIDFTRKARQQVTFGHGIHQCLGQQMARVELQIVFPRLFDRIPTLTLAQDVESLPFKHDGVIYGLHAFPVRW